MDHFAHLLRLLDLESQAEKDVVVQKRNRLSPDAAEASGTTLLGMRIRDSYSALGGRTMVVLGKRNQQDRLPWTRLGSGTPIVLSPQAAGDDSSWRGVVTARSADTISLALSDWPELNDATDVRIDASFDETSRQRQRAALLDAQKSPSKRVAQLRDALLGACPLKFAPEIVQTPLDESLNASQRSAVQFALAAHDIAIVHGPPGTGKTTAVIEIIRRCVRQGDKVLACAPSNLAVDNLLERLVRAGENVVRLGHPARVLPELREHTLDLLVDRHDDIAVARRLVKQAFQLRHQADRFTRAKPLPGAKRELREEAKALLSDARRLEEQVAAHLLDRAQVVCATLTGVDRSILGDQHFDMLVIDEAGQATEPPCWIPLSRCERIILAGDPFQLPPTIVSNEARQEGFGISLLERLMKAHGSTVCRRLTTQYRMHSQIAQFSSREFYEGSLIADASVENHLLCDLPCVEMLDYTTVPLEFVDTAGAGYDEELEPDGESRRNPQEATLVQRRVEQLHAAGLTYEQMAVITPYAAQARLVRELLGVDELEVDTVDAFQGREKEAVIVSLVRSNTRREVGFLSDVRRMNVALTRARRKLIVIGDSATIGGHAFYSRLLDYFEKCGAYHSVWEDA